jgi:hypothetical protein
MISVDVYSYRCDGGGMRKKKKKKKAATGNKMGTKQNKSEIENLYSIVVRFRLHHDNERRRHLRRHLMLLPVAKMAQRHQQHLHLDDEIGFVFLDEDIGFEVFVVALFETIHFKRTQSTLTLW